MHKPRNVVTMLMLVFFLASPAFANELAALTKAASYGNAAAQVKLGLIYANGDGVERDFPTAERWWTMAAGQGDAQAQYDLGYLYQQGVPGVRRDSAKAKEWWLKAAGQNHVGAQFQMGMLYIKGEIVSGSYVTAFNWFQKAAMQGNAQCQFNLGLMYGKGMGVEQNNVLAHVWLSLAQDQQIPAAADFLEGLVAVMAEGELAQAEQKKAILVEKLRKQQAG